MAQFDNYVLISTYSYESICEPTFVLPYYLDSKIFLMILYNMYIRYSRWTNKTGTKMTIT
jgi:hypothetical protein